MAALVGLVLRGANKIVYMSGSGSIACCMSVSTRVHMLPNTGGSKNINFWRGFVDHGLVALPVKC